MYFLHWMNRRLKKPLPLFALGGIATWCFWKLLHREMSEHKQKRDKHTNTTCQRVEQALRKSEHRLRRILEYSPDGILVIDQQGVVLYANPAAQHLLDWPNLEGQYFGAPLVFGESTELDVVYPMLKSKSSELRVSRQDGAIGVVEMRVLEIDWEGQNACIVTLRDHTEYAHAREAVQHANSQLTHWIIELEQYNREVTLLNGMGDSLQKCQTTTEAYRVISKTAPQIFPGQSGALYIFNDAHTRIEATAKWGELKGPASFHPSACPALQETKIQVIECANKAKQCGDTDILACGPISVCVPLVTQNESFGVLSLHGVLGNGLQERDRWKRLITMVADHLTLSLANLRLREQLLEQSIRDPLTGLFNRRYLDETLERELCRANRLQHPISVIMLDIDHFKHYNDTYGHDGGDALLREVSVFLQTFVRGDDIVCRYGGEEFTLVLPGASLHDSANRAAEICTAITHVQATHQGSQLGIVTASLGVACFPTHGATANDIIGSADVALYRAKHEGRNRVCVAN